MGRKNLIICIFAVLALLIANATALFFLYCDADMFHISRSAEHRAQKQAVVPSDTLAIAPDQQQDADSLQPAEATQPSPTTAETAQSSEPAKAAEPMQPAEPAYLAEYKVKNSSTGKINTIVQEKDYTIVLKDENSKVLWKVPFEGPLCSRVKEIDFFANGKLQYLMASGNKLYLLDRLGRMVEGFPVTLPQKVLLGPDVYDFNSQKRYNIVVLNENNTIDMYNLKGQKPTKWKTISTNEAPLSLPEYSEANGKSYWTVTTASHKYTFSFYGEQLKVTDTVAGVTAAETTTKTNK